MFASEASRRSPAASCASPALHREGAVAGNSWPDYLATDICLLAGIAGYWARQRATIGIAGTIGIAIFVAGILAVRASAFGIGSYPIGALIALVGLAVYALDALLARRGAVWAPALWLTAFAAALAGAFLADSLVAFALSALAFGLGFVAAGIETLRR